MLEKIKEKQLFTFIILGTIAFIIIHLFHTYWGTPASDLFDIEVDNSLPEIFLYVQELGIVILLFSMWRKDEKLVYLAWTLIFTYVLLDDSLLLHERIGVFLVDAFGVENNYGVRGRDITEVAVQLGFGIPLVTFAAWAHFFRADPPSRRISVILFFLLALLATFAIIIDWFHVKIMIEGSKEIIGTIEDGGEMFIVTATLWYVFRQVRMSEKLFGG
ncbi:MAG: hypothetical protein ACI9EW_003628 [Cellvibrionaceae bacterium]|jgi:hypothetical protein